MLINTHFDSYIRWFDFTEDSAIFKPSAVNQETKVKRHKYFCSSFLQFITAVLPVSDR